MSVSKVYKEVTKTVVTTKEVPVYRLELSEKEAIALAKLIGQTYYAGITPDFYFLVSEDFRNNYGLDLYDLKEIVKSDGVGAEVELLEELKELGVSEEK